MASIRNYFECLHLGVQTPALFVSNRLNFGIISSNMKTKIIGLCILFNDQLQYENKDKRGLSRIYEPVLYMWPID